MHHEPDSCDDSEAYRRALKQIRLDIRDGGLGLTIANCIASAAHNATMLDFVIWWDQHEELKARASGNCAASNITSALDSMEQCGGIQRADEFVDPPPANSPLRLPTADGVLHWPVQKLQSQRTIIRALKAHDKKQFVSELPEGDKLRLKAVSRQAVPAQS